MLLPHNCEGEIVIGGENLSSGYLNENITKEKFVTIDEVTDKLYKVVILVIFQVIQRLIILAE